MQNTQRRDKIRTLKGFALSLLLHLLIVLLFWVSAEKFLSPPAPKQEKKITLDLSQFVPPAPPPKPQVKPVPPPQPVIPPQPKPKKVVEKKPEPKKKVLDEKKIVTAKKDIQENNVTKSAKKPEKKIVKKKKKKKEKKKVVKKEKKVLKKKVVKKAPPKKPKKKKVTQKKPRKKQYTSPLASSLMGSGKSKSMQTSSRRQAASPATRRMIKQLYGSEFNSYGAEQKKFIENNLAIIHRITQSTLNRNGYPEIAARTGQQGVNVVSFYLHPNGNISRLRLERHMGHEALDKNTIQVIRLAYKDYPLPRKKTKIKFYVQYSIDGY